MNTLEQVLKQKHTTFEVILVDQNPTLPIEMVERLQCLKSEGKLLHLRSQGWGNLPAARNRGLEVAQGDLIVFVDDDVCIEANFLDAYQNAFESKPYLASVVGRVLAPKSPDETDVKLGEPIKGDDLSSTEAKYVSQGRGCNMAFRKDFLTKNNLWFEHRFLGNALLEESELFARIDQAGGQIFFEPRAVLVHLADRTGGCRTQTFKDGKRKLRHFACFFHNHWLYESSRSSFRPAVGIVAKKCRSLMKKDNLFHQGYLLASCAVGLLLFLRSKFLIPGNWSSRRQRYPVIESW